MPQSIDTMQKQRKAMPPKPLRIEPKPNTQHIALALGDEDSSTTLSSADSDYPPFQPPPSARSFKKNMKKLSLNLDSAQSSVVSLQDQIPSLLQTPIRPERPRRPSIASLPTINATSSLLHRKEEEGDNQTVPYSDGPVQIIPGIWIGSEDNARDWKGLIERGIRSVLNVAKEVTTPFDSTTQSHHPLRTALSTPDFRSTNHPDPTYCPPHVPSGRPAMHYLKLQWSHGQQDLVKSGFKDGMQFADAALKRGEGCLIHCQCGISRSATMVIALVMRAAAERHQSVPPEIWALKGMQGAYSYVKDKSPCVGPNMSLIYQLLEYEKKLRGDKGSPNESDGASSGTDEEEEWGRRRQLLDESEEEHESSAVMQEAKALDKAMEDRIVARKSSASSMSSGLGMGPVWRSRYNSRKRTGSIASTAGSLLSDEVVEEEEEEEETSSIGATSFDSESRRSQYIDSASTTPDDETGKTPRAVSLLTPGPATARPPPSAPVWKTSFTFPLPPTTAIRSSFALPSLPPKPKAKRKPLGLSLLPPVPSSPITLIVEPEEPEQPPVVVVAPAQPPASISRSASSSSLSLPPVRQRTESRRLVPPPLHLRNSILRKASAAASEADSIAPTPSQTLFVFPPSPTMNARTPSTMTLMSSAMGPVPFPSLSTPRVSTFRSKGRTRSFIGLGAPPTPTVAFSKVDVRGIVGLE